MSSYLLSKMGISSSKSGNDASTTAAFDICLSKKRDLEKAVSTFLLSVDSLQSTATHFAVQLKINQGDRKVKDTYKSAVQVLQTCQVLNKGLMTSFEEEFKNFFTSIANVIKKDLKVPLPEGFETFHSVLRPEQQHDDTTAGDYIEHKTDEIVLKDGIIESLEDEIDQLKTENKQLTKDLDDNLNLHVSETTVKNLEANVKVLEAKNDDLGAKTNKMRLEIDQLKLENTQLVEKHRDEITQMNTDTINKTEDLTKAKLVQDEYIHKIFEDLNRTESELKDLKFEHEELSKECKKKEYDINNLNDEIEKRKQEIEKLTNECYLKYESMKQLHDDANKKDMEIKDLKSKTEDLRNECSDKNKTVDEQNEKIEEMTKKIERLKSETKILTHDGEVKDTFIKEQNGNIKTLKSKIEELESKIAVKDVNIDRLGKDAQEMQKKIDALTSDVSKTNSKIEDLKTTNETLSNDCHLKDKKIEKLNADVSHKTSEITRLKNTNGELTAVCHSNDETIRELRGEVETKNSDIENLESRIEALQSECSELQINVKDMDSDIGELTSKNKALTYECSEKTKAIMKLRNDAENAKIEINKLSIECDGHVAKNMQLEDKVKYSKIEIEKLHNANDSMQQEVRGLQRDLGKVQSDCEKLADELRILKSKMLIRVNLFCHHRSNIITNIEQALMIILKEKIEENQLELNFVQFTDKFDDNGDPTIALCMTTSRIGTDAENAVKDMSMSAKTALLMIHHKDEHALPQQASERVLTSPGFKQLGCITDMAFLSGKGFFPCEINNNSIVRLVNFIRKEGVKHRKHDS